MDTFQEIRALLRQKGDCQARLRLLPYDGSPEVKIRGDGKYLYTRKRLGSRLSSTYVGAYSDELHQLLLRNAKEARALRKQMRHIEKRLAALGYQESELSPRVVLNLDFARAHLKTSIYDQAVLEGIATSFPQTAQIIENGQVSGMTASDVQKILNLKHAWEFILDAGVIQSESGYHILCHIAALVNEGFFADGGRLRGVPVTIGGSTYVPPLPIESLVKEQLEEILHSPLDNIDKAIALCLYVMKAQLFLDGNKRSAVLFANHQLIAHGQGLLVIPEGEVPQFKRLLLAHYEGAHAATIADFLKSRCWKRF